MNDEQVHASNEPTSVNDTPLVDHGVLDELSEALGEDMIPDLIGQSIDDMRTNVTRMVELAEAADLAAVQRQAHDLKGTSGGFGAIRLQRLAQALDLACKEDREDDARQLLTEIMPVAQETFDALAVVRDARSSEIVASALPT